MTLALKKIMLIEDDPDIQLITRLSLEMSGGYDVYVCASGAEAIQAASAYAPDLVLLDMMMPGMDGPTVMDALRAQSATAATPFVFFTANTQDEVREELRRRGALGVITKPVEPAALVQQIRELWQRFAAKSA